MDTAIIFVALIGLMVMAYRGASIILIAPVFAVVAALGSEHASLPIFSELYMTKAAEYLKNYYPIFLFGAVFARLMEKGGMAASVAGKIIEILGEKRAVLAVLLGCGALTYGGLSVFVVAFVMYPFGAVVFKKADIPKRLLPAALWMGIFSFAMVAMPGTPQIQNIIPSSYFGTSTWSGMGIGIFATLIFLFMGWAWISFRAKRLKAQGESVENDMLPTSKGNVCIDNISFRYEKDKPLIDDFSLDVKSGQNIAIVGPTGCGKTTFINLLMRFYDVDKGVISVDGVDIKTVDRHSLRSNYGMVLQDTWIKKASVKENVILGKPDASDEEIIEASKKAHSYEFIKRLPDGFDTVISDDDLSVGQKQLLCITRVMLALPPMLILDEATSSIDTFTENEIQSAFDSLMENRTSFVVAHRLSTIYNADVILVMKDGHIIEKGNHAELMKKNGFYTKLYNAQFVKS
mgnify:CR=1 FL=1